MAEAPEGHARYGTLGGIAALPDWIDGRPDG